MLNCGDRVDRYVVEAVLGEGGLARVYRVRHEHLGGQYALKLLSFRGERLSKRLVREGRIQARLQHPNIVRVHDAFELEGRGALLMEYVEGESLDRVLNEKGPVPLDEALHIFGQVLTGVGVAHDAGVLHRDLKPGNILLQSRGGLVTPKVTDFGIARLLSASTAAGDTLQSDVIGTPGFMAPEQASDPTAVDVRADLFSLGAILYGMVTGWPPFPTTSLAEVLAAAENGDFVPVLQRVPSCPPRVAAVIERCLAPDPNDRFDSCRAVAAALFGEQSTEVAAVELGSTHGGAGLADADRADSRLPKAKSLQKEAVALGDTLEESPPRPNVTAVPLPSVDAAVSEALGREPASPARGLLLALVMLLALGAVAIVWFFRGQDRSGPEPIAEPSAAAVEAPPAASGPPSERSSPGPEPASPVSPAPPAGDPPAEAAPEPASPPRAELSDAAAAPPPVPDETPVETTLPTGVEAAERAGSAAPAEVPPSAAGEPETPAVQDAEPEPEPEPGASASDAVAVLTEEEPAGAPDPQPAPAGVETASLVVGSWSGRLGGRPSRLQITEQAGTEVKAVLEVLQGTAYRTFRLMGTLEGDRLRLQGTTEAPWRLDVRLVNGALEGGLTAPGRKKATAWRGTRD